MSGTVNEALTRVAINVHHLIAAAAHHLPEVHPSATSVAQIVVAAAIHGREVA